jgi:hypothetical protein
MAHLWGVFEGPLARRYPAVLPGAFAAPVGSRLVFGSSLACLGSRLPQLIGLISGVMTGVTAGAMGFMGASAAAIAGLRFAAFLAGFFLAAFLAGFRLAAFFFEDFFLEDFFFAVFFFATRFFDARFLDDFFFAFFADFFFAAFFFAAMFNSFQCCRSVVPEPDGPLGTTKLRFASNAVGEAILCTTR